MNFYSDAKMRPVISITVAQLLLIVTSFTLSVVYACIDMLG